MLTNVGGCAYIPHIQESGIEIENFVTKTGDVLSRPLHPSIRPQQNTELTNKQLCRCSDRRIHTRSEDSVYE